MKATIMVASFGLAVALGGAGNAVEIKVPPLVQKFFAAKEKQARGLATAEKKELPPEFSAFFTAAARGDWPAVTNLYGKMMRQRSSQYDQGKGGKDEDFHCMALQSVVETYGALEQFIFGEEKYVTAFGRDIIDSIPADSIYFGGNDSGRFLVSALCQSQIEGKPFFVLSQNALTDGTYLNYLRNMYGGKIHTPSAEDSQKAYSAYLEDAQRRLDHDRRFPNEPKQIKPGEDIRMAENRVQVSGHVAVMAINGILTKIMFDLNANREFYVVESFPLDWMYPHLVPHGLIMKLHRQPLAELTEDIVKQDHEYWSRYVAGMIGDWIAYDTPVKKVADFAEKVYIRKDLAGFKGDPKFVQNDYTRKMFSKLRCSIGGVYHWRFADASNKLRSLQMRTTTQPDLLPEVHRLTTQQQQMLKEADFAFRQAWVLCPNSPEAIFRYVTLLVNIGRVGDALIMAQVSGELDSFNGQIANLIAELKRIKSQQEKAGSASPSVAKPPQATIAQLEQDVGPTLSNLPAAYGLVNAYIQSSQSTKALELLDKLMDSPQANQETFIFAAQTCNRLGELGRVEKALEKMVKLAPESPEAWFDLAAIQAIQDHRTQALNSLRQALTKNSERLAKNPKQRNLYDTVMTDTRFGALRQSPEFRKLLSEFKPPSK